MRLVSFDDGGGDRLGVEHSDGRTWSSRALGADLPATMTELLAGGDASLGALRAAVAVAAASDLAGDVDASQRVAPVPRPGKVVAVGLNYHSHAVEGGVEPPERPMLFCKFSTSVVGDGDTVEWDPTLTQGVDLEAELGVVIGRTARHVSEADALSYVAGYTCVNDVSARDLQFADGQFVRSKSLDTFCPIGPVVVTSDEIPDPGVLDISSSLNGEPMQSSNTSDLIFSVANVAGGRGLVPRSSRGDARRRRHAGRDRAYRRAREPLPRGPGRLTVGPGRLPG